MPHGKEYQAINTNTTRPIKIHMFDSDMPNLIKKLLTKTENTSKEVTQQITAMPKHTSKKRRQER